MPQGQPNRKSRAIRSTIARGQYTFIAAIGSIIFAAGCFYLFGIWIALDPKWFVTMLFLGFLGVGLVLMAFDLE